MSRTRWYRSLYWRIALGLFAFLALMLAAQGALVLWMTERVAGSMPAASPDRLAEIVASDISAALAADEGLDVEEYVRAQYAAVFRPFLIVMRDGRTITNHDDVPAALQQMGRDEAQRLARFAMGPPGREFPPRGGGPRQGGPPDVLPPPGGRGDGPLRLRMPPRGRPGGLPRRGEFATIFLNREPVGRVVVFEGRLPFSRIVRELGPAMGLIGGGVLAVGMTLVALVVFGPARRRLRQVQDATGRLGAGDLSARAPEKGGDEVAEVARAFNRMADELTARASALAASDTARRQLLADVSHELMTPLTAMRGYIETLGMPELTLDPATRDRYLAIVSDETHRLERIVGDLLDLARLEGGGAPMRREPVAVDALFDRIAARHEGQMEARQITLSRHVAPEASHVPGDADRLERALQNLASNALRHMPDGGTLTLAADPVEAGVRIRVRDTGQGIPHEHLPLIFDRFYKADAARPAMGGSGLGLSIVRAIVGQHGGTIVAYNDGGAVFDLTLPRNVHT
jgi:signal transduction histidine kinase